MQAGSGLHAESFLWGCGSGGEATAGCRVARPCLGAMPSYCVLACRDGVLYVYPATTERESLALARDIVGQGDAPVLVVQKLHLFATCGYKNEDDSDR